MRNQMGDHYLFVRSAPCRRQGSSGRGRIASRTILLNWQPVLPTWTGGVCPLKIENARAWPSLNVSIVLVAAGSQAGMMGNFVADSYLGDAVIFLEASASKIHMIGSLLLQTRVNRSPIATTFGKLPPSLPVENFVLATTQYVKHCAQNQR